MVEALVLVIHPQVAMERRLLVPALSDALITIKDATGDVIISGIKTDNNGGFSIDRSELSNNEPFFLKAIKLNRDFSSEIIYSFFTTDMINNGLKLTPVSSMIASIALPQGNKFSRCF